MSTLTTILGAGVLWFVAAFLFAVALCRAAANGDRQLQAELDRLRRRDAA